MAKEIEYIIEDGQVTLFGRLIPEDADEFFDPLYDELSLIVHGKKDCVFNFKFEYYNTAATRYIGAIIKLMELLSFFARSEVNWYYLEDDEDLEELGKIYQEGAKVNFNLIKVTSF